jgi:hypothetical protein
MVLNNGHPLMLGEIGLAPAGDLIPFDRPACDRFLAGQDRANHRAAEKDGSLFVEWFWCWSWLVHFRQTPLAADKVSLVGAVPLDFGFFIQAASRERPALVVLSAP